MYATINSPTANHGRTLPFSVRPSLPSRPSVNSFHLFPPPGCCVALSLNPQAAVIRINPLISSHNPLEIRVIHLNPRKNNFHQEFFFALPFRSLADSFVSIRVNSWFPLTFPYTFRTRFSESTFPPQPSFTQRLTPKKHENQKITAVHVSLSPALCRHVTMSLRRSPSQIRIDTLPSPKYGLPVNT